MIGADASRDEPARGRTGRRHGDVELMTTIAPKHHVAHAMNQLRHVPGLTAVTRGREIRKAGVVGAGLMGSGIAVCLLAAGVPTTLVDVTQSALDRGRSGVEKALASFVKRGLMFESQAKGLQALLSESLEFSALADCDVIIEAVYEKLTLKEEVFRRLGEIAKPGAILATNTSGLDVDRIASASGRAADVVGLHFFSPAFMMPLLEIVRGRETSLEVLRSALHLSTIMRKVGVVVGNSPGFAANRTLEGYGRESEFLVLEGARPEDVDRALTQFGFPMGPCAMGDMAGLDIRNHYVEALREARLIPPDPRYGALTKALVAAGRLGQKTSAGNYDYGPDGRTPIPSARALEIRDRVARELGVPQRAFTDEEIVMRCLLPVIDEAARVLAEGVVPRASDIDVIWLYGYGFPAAKGGPIYLARQLGLDAVRQGIDARRRADPGFGDRYWTPNASLELLFT